MARPGPNQPQSSSSSPKSRVSTFLLAHSRLHKPNQFQRNLPMKKMQTPRGESWKSSEEISLCLSVITTGENGDKVTGQANKKLWDRIAQVYETCKPPNAAVRSGGSCESRWRRIRPACMKWRLALSQAEEAAQASSQNATEMDLELQARSIYRSFAKGKDFQYAHCWAILGDSLKFSKPPGMDTPVVGSSPIKLDEDGPMTHEETPSLSKAHPPLPLCQNAQKETKRKKTEDNSTQIVAQMRRLADQGDRDLLHRQKLFEMNKQAEIRAEEEKIMSIDPSKYPPHMRAYWERKQAKIIEKEDLHYGHNGGSSNQSDACIPGNLKMAETSKEVQYPEIKSFFDSAPPLKNRDDVSEKLEAFVKKNSPISGNGGSRRVVCVTSGGTTVPLEQRCVRYIDNFSSGHRGAASTEYFLKAGYAVIFFFRRGSCQPFCRSLPDDPLVECLEFGDESSIQVRQSHSQALGSAYSKTHAAVTDGLLLKLPFTTIFEYLQMLHMVAYTIRSIGPHAMFYLAAAVSDFYVPWQSMAEHKIQSGSGPLDMRLVQVPKMLLVLRRDWAPMAFCISFKLETDSKILLEKADMALRKYKMHMVVASELMSRKEEVVLVSGNEKISVRRNESLGVDDVDSALIDLLVEKHSTYVERSDLWFKLFSSDV